MGLPVKGSTGVEPASVGTQLCSVLDRCATQALYNVTGPEWPTVLQQEQNILTK